MGIISDLIEKYEKDKEYEYVRVFRSNTDILTFYAKRRYKKEEEEEEERSK